MPKTRKVFDRLILHNVRCFHRTTVPFDSKVTVILGENGSGKSTIVECLAALAEKRVDAEAFPLRVGEQIGEMALYVEHRKSPAGLWRSGRETGFRPIASDFNVFGYGRYRRVYTGQPSQLNSSTPGVILDQLARYANERRTDTLTKPGTLLNDLSRYLVALNFGRRSDRRLQKVWDSVLAALPTIDAKLREFILVDDNGAGSARFVRGDVPLEFHELSDGYQSFLVILFDLALRYSYIFELDNPLNGEATVLIDEIDLHLHPRWQRKAVQQLTYLFPNTQFIMTSHSPIIAQATIDSSHTVVILKESRSSMVTATVLSKRMRDRLRGAEVGSILLEDRLFGVESRYSVNFSEIEKKIDHFQYLVSSNNATQKDEAELLRALTTFEELVAKEDERRADGSTLAQIVRLEIAFVKDLVRELRREKA